MAEESDAPNDDSLVAPDGDFGAVLRQLRASVNETQEEWAARLGVSTRTVARWEREWKWSISLGQRLAIARALEQLRTPEAARASKMLGAELPSMANASSRSDFTSSSDSRSDFTSVASSDSRSVSRWNDRPEPSVHTSSLGDVLGMRRHQNVRAMLATLVEIEKSAERLGTQPHLLSVELEQIIGHAEDAGLSIEDLRRLVRYEAP